jgi:hypothetical protein
MTIKELLEMEIHEEYVFNHHIVLRVPGGWIYEIEAYKNGAYTGRTTSCFVPEPSLQTITPTNNGYDEWLDTIESNQPEPEDYDKTAEADKELLTMGRFH